MAASLPFLRSSSGVQQLMPYTPVAKGATRKRKRSARKPLHDEPQRINGWPSRRTPSALFDNLSRLWLTPRALREFDRRTSWPTIPPRPQSYPLQARELRALKRFARLGGPSLDDIRSYPELPTTAPPVHHMDSQQRRSGTRKTTAYDPLFEQNLIDHGVFPYGYDLDDDPLTGLPSNLDEIHAVLRRPRPSLSSSTFSWADFRRFEKVNASAETENGVMTTAFRTIVGESSIPNQQNILFNNLAPLTDGSIAEDQPDFYDGVRPANVDQRVRRKLSPYIEPSTNKVNPCVPTFFAEGKGPKGTAAVCKRQACYDGALGARAVHELRKYTDSGTVFDNNAYTISSTYAGGAGGGLLTLYATHPTWSDDQGRTEYHMTRLRGFCMTDQPESFREGARALRNARDWAYGKREELIAAANAKAQSDNPNAPGYGRAQVNEVRNPNETSRDGNGEASLPSTPHSGMPSSDVSTAAGLDSNTSLDEPALDLSPPAKRARKNSELSP